MNFAITGTGAALVITIMLYYIIYIYIYNIYNICYSVLVPLRPKCKEVMKLPYFVMQYDRNSSKTDTFREPTIYEPHVRTSLKKNTFGRDEYGRVGVFRIKMKSLVQYF